MICAILYAFIIRTYSLTILTYEIHTIYVLARNIHTKSHRYMNVHANVCNYMQIHTNTYKYMHEARLPYYTYSLYLLIYLPTYILAYLVTYRFIRDLCRTVTCTHNDYLELSEAIGSYLALPGALDTCNYLEVSGGIWKLSGGIWRYMEVARAICTYLELAGALTSEKNNTPKP